MSGEANTSQQIEQRKLELVEALSSLVAPMDEILANHKDTQVRQARVLQLMVVGCVLIVMLLAGIGYVLHVQFAQRELVRSILEETLAQKKALNDQGKKTDDVAAKLDQQPKISVRPPASSDPSGAPVVVIETPPHDTSSAKPRNSSAVEIPIKLPTPDKKK